MIMILLLTLLDACWILCSTIFTMSFVKDHDFATLVPCVIFYLITIIFSYMLIVEAFIGRKTYTCDDDLLYVWRKGKIRKYIHKESVSKVTLILDVFSEELYLMSFVYEDKKHYVSINKDNEADILEFIDGKDFTKRKNWWYYIIEFLGW